jgi:hypothetical protein
MDVAGWIAIALGLLNLLVLVWLALRPAGTDGRSEVLAAVQASGERVERELRREVGESARGARQELTHNLASFQEALVKQGAEATRTQNAQIDAFGQQLALLQKTLSDTLTLQLTGLSESNARRLAEVRATLETQLAQMQQTNAAKLDEMRRTVDESCRPRWKPVWARASSRWPTGWSRCTRAWARCRAWRRVWVTSSTCSPTSRRVACLARRSWLRCWSRCSRPTSTPCRWSRARAAATRWISPSLAGPRHRWHATVAAH